MKESTLIFCKKVALTTFCAFFFVTTAIVGIFALVGGGAESGAPATDLQFFRYLAMKLYLCVLPFSLCLGFSARIFDTKKPRALQRLIHFFLCLAAYVVFMDLIFNNTNRFIFTDISDVITLRDYIMDTVPFFVGYPLTAGVSALGRALFTPKEKKTHKSILD